MKDFRFSFQVLASLLILAVCTPAAANSPVPPATEAYWRTIAPVCDQVAWAFPAKIDAAVCDDGDATLFAGLMCMSGEAAGCDAARAAIGPSGQWFRSPRRAANSNLGLPNSFSPDMALGAELYLAKTRDAQALAKWHAWMDSVRPCWIGSGPNCVQSFFVRFCTDDDEKGCTARPTDLAMLQKTSQFLNAFPSDRNVRNLLENAAPHIFDLIWADSQANRPGYSQHLVAVEIYLLRAMGISEPKLDAAARALSDKQPLNPFFEYLDQGPGDRARDLTLSQCPKVGDTPSTRNEWAWEREDSEQAWKRSMIWDCIFMANLLR